MSDRFSKATKEQEERSVFICTSCKNRYNRKDADEKELECCGRTLTELTQEAFGP